MSLTNRKKQFLEKLMDLYESSSLPVHYESLAKAIGVSKWTAYDMVKQLEKMNLLKKEYVVNSNETGRSQVVYSPTEAAYQIINETLDGDISDKEWEKAVEDLLNILKNLEHKDPDIVFQEILERMPTIKNKTVLSANVLTLLVSYVKYTNKFKLEKLIHLINLVDQDATKITIFAGGVVGLFLKETKNLSIEVMDLASEHVNAIDRLSPESQKKMASFLLKALSI